MSGGCNTGRSWDAAFEAGDRFTAAAGCIEAADTASCLRGSSVETLLQALPPTTPYAVTVDGYALADRPERVIARGEHHRVPVIIGNTSEEEGGSGAGISTPADFENAVLALFPYPTAMPLVRQQYPMREYVSPRDAYVALAGDFKYGCPLRRAARAFLAGQLEPVHRYIFRHVRDNAPADIRSLGARHSADIPYVFEGWTPPDMRSPRRNSASSKPSPAISQRWRLRVPSMMPGSPLGRCTTAPIPFSHSLPRSVPTAATGGGNAISGIIF
jgi:para-nitrobenzyl esterase